ncbi:potassium channel protein [Rhodococcus sp. X156]|uniref:potassium channel family protein n=1 Tax=Rhodococcus sp. X156 TaxID=2499145 RepID=UPI000FD9DD6C|nr:potassium channel protein [Rhodococcus sp. X156]
MSRRSLPPEEQSALSAVTVPGVTYGPTRAILLRIAGALTALIATVGLVYLDRNGYRDVTETPLSLADCFYYATVTLSTTGYGDITPYTPSARMINGLVITPLRVIFLIVLIGTTLEVLTERSRQAFKINRWSKKVRGHTVVIGFGTKGRSAVAALLGDGVEPSSIVVVDTDATMLSEATALGVVTVHGSATRSDILRLANVPRAASIIVAANRDDTAVLATLSARELAPKAKIIAAVREADNVHSVRQSGADQVVVSSETAGRLLGIATTAPTIVQMMADLLTPDAGFAIAERDVEPREVGGSPRHLSDIVLGVVRNDILYRVDEPAVDAIENGDRLLYIRNAD